MKKSRWAVSAIFFIAGFTHANYAARFPKLQDHFQLDNSALGFVLLSLSLGALLAMPFTGWLISHFSSKKVASFSALSFAVAVPLFMLSPNAIVLALAFFAMGLVTGMMDVSMNAQAVLVEKAYEKPIMSFFHAMFSIGMVAGSGSGALFSKLNIDLLPHFFIIFCLDLIVLIIAFRFLIAEGKTASTTPLFRIPERVLIGIGLIAFCGMVAEGAMVNWSTNYMWRVVQVTEASAAFGLLAFSVSMTTGRFLGDHFRLLLGDSRMIIFGGSLASVGLAIAIIFPYFIPTALGFLIVGTGLATVVPIAYSRAGTMPGINPGVGIAMVTTIGYTGFLVGPPIIGYLGDWYDLKMAFLFVLTLTLTMTVIAFFNKRSLN